jgi:hypothetical protein
MGRGKIVIGACQSATISLHHSSGFFVPQIRKTRTPVSPSLGGLTSQNGKLECFPRVGAGFTGLRRL